MASVFAPSAAMGRPGGPDIARIEGRCIASPPGIGQRLVSDDFWLGLGGSREAAHDPRRPTRLLCDLGFLLFDQLTGRVIAIKPADDLHRNAPVGCPTPILEDDIEQDRAPFLRGRFRTLGHAGADKPPARRALGRSARRAV